MSLRELLGDIADRGMPGELAGPAWRRARRLRVRRRVLGVAAGAAAGLVLVATSFATGLLASSEPPGFPAASRSPAITGVSTPVTSGDREAGYTSTLPSLGPGQLPGGWLWGGGPDGNGNTFVHDRGTGALTELPYDWAIPAPTGDLVFVTNRDDWAGVLNLRTDAITPLQGPGTSYGPWSVGMPQWSGDGKRLLRADGSQVYITDAVTGDSRRVELQGGCGRCDSVVWLPGEEEVGIPLSGKASDGLQIYSVGTGEKLRRVPWYDTRLHGFSPDGRYVVARLGGGSAIVDVASGRRVAPLNATDPRTAYWAGPDVVLVVEHGGAIAYSLQGMRMVSYPWPVRFGDGELPDFTLIRRDSPP